MAAPAVVDAARSLIGQPPFEEAARIEQVVGTERFGQKVAELARELDRPEPEVLDDARSALSELAAAHDPRALWTWQRLCGWLTRGYELGWDEPALARLRELDERHSLVFLISHRSYLDTWVLPQVLEGGEVTPIFGLGGANLDFWPFGPLARRSGLVFIRRRIGDDPIYKLALREYLSLLVATQTNLAWSLEGGRTRTGKLRPPNYGLLRYLIDATRAAGSEHVLLVPTSIVYDTLDEASDLAAQASGGEKEKEDLRWLAGFARRQGRLSGTTQVDFAEPIALIERLEQLEREAPDDRHAVERVALEVCHRINEATPVMPTALVIVALLGAERALTLDELVRAVEPLAGYVARRGYPVTGGIDPAERSRLRSSLDELVGRGVAVCYDEGIEAVWRLDPGQELVAAFYRNTAIHVFVNRAIVELVCQRVIEKEPEDLLAASWEEALRLRELFKFEFFFSRRRDFAVQIREETALVDEGWERRAEHTPHEYVRRWQAREWLEQARPHVAHLVLRPFVEAYLVVAELLVAADAREPVEEDAFLADCLAVARQWHLQGRITSAESVSLELLGTALRLAAHRGLLDPEGEDPAERRRELLDELRDVAQRVEAIAARARTAPG